MLDGEIIGHVKEAHSDKDLYTVHRSKGCSLLSSQKKAGTLRHAPTKK